VYIRACNWIRSWTINIQWTFSHNIYIRCILILSSHPKPYVSQVTYHVQIFQPASRSNTRKSHLPSFYRSSGTFLQVKFINVISTPFCTAPLPTSKHPSQSPVSDCLTVYEVWRSYVCDYVMRYLVVWQKRIVISSKPTASVFGEKYGCRTRLQSVGKILPGLTAPLPRRRRHSPSNYILSLERTTKISTHSRKLIKIHFCRFRKISKSDHYLRQSVRIKLGYHWTISIKFDTWLFFENLTRKCKFH